MEKIGFVSLGCSKNLIDTEVMLGILRDKHMEITDDLAVDRSEARIGATVTIKDLAADIEFTYTLVGSMESNPDKGLLSVKSPLASGVLGKKEGEEFVVTLSDGGEIRSDFLVIATGGKSYPSTGSTGDGYEFAKSFGHSVVKPVPSLVQLLTKEDVSPLNGISLKNIELSAVLPDGGTLSEFGEMLFTKRGLSGPVALSLSARLNRVSGGVLALDLKPALTHEKLDARVLRDFAERKNADLKNVTRALLPERLNLYVLKRAGLSPEEKVNAVTREERGRLVDTVKGLTFSFAGVGPFEEAVVTSGGVDVKELTPKCESRLVPGLYFTGEVIDCDAYTGGYNLQIAFSTAAQAAGDIIARGRKAAGDIATKAQTLSRD